MSMLYRTAQRLSVLPCYSKNISVCCACIISSKRRSSSKTQFPKDNHVVTVTKNGEKIVLWHPQKEYPYELSKPMPRDKRTLDMGDNSSMLQYHPVLDEKISKVGPTVTELIETFHAPKATWFPRAKEKRLAERKVPAERNSL